MTVFTGTVTTLAEHHAVCRDPLRIATGAIRLWPSTETIADAFTSCIIDDVLLTSHFVPIDLGRSRLILDQSYSGLTHIMPVRFQVSGDAFALESDPVFSAGRHIVIGGPIDLVWYHWLFNWCPRVLLAKMLRPDLFAAPDARFVVHPSAMREPYRAVLDTFGLNEARFLVVDPDRDYRLEQACLVSFLDQDKLFPTMIRHFADHLIEAFGIGSGASHRGVFASRQGLPPPKRRIANFHEIEPVLRSFGLDVASLGTLAAAEQARLFREAALVVGAHGSDLANILFCRPGTPVIVIENQFSVDHRLHMGLLKLAEVLQLEYRLVISATADDSVHLPTAQRIGRDYVVDPQQLGATMRLALDGRRDGR